MALISTRTLHEIRVTFLPDGSIESRVQTDLVLIKDGDTELKRSLEAVALDEAQMTALLGEQFAGVAAQVTSLTAERDALKPQADALPVLTQERDALAAEKTTLTLERDAARAEAATVQALKDQIITLKGTPVFKAEDIIKQLTTDEKSHITQAVSGNPELLALWSEFLGRVVAGKEMPLDSPTVQTGIAGLRQILGEERVAALFATLNIDLVAGRYIQPLPPQG